MSIKLAEILKAIKGRLLWGREDISVKEAFFDSRKIKPKSLFIAIKGKRLDGSFFIEEAIKRGAEIIVCDRLSSSRLASFKKFYSNKSFILVDDARQATAKIASLLFGQPAKRLNIIGITGTNGKTTTSYLVEKILSSEGINCGLIGTINYRFAKYNISSTFTTPDALRLHSLLFRMVKEGITHVIMEVSSHALDQQRLAEIKFYTAIFTNLSSEHLDYHQNMNKYFLAKAKLFKQLKRNGFVLLNEDDRYAKKLKKIIEAKTYTYGLGNSADFRGEILNMNIEGMSLRIVFKKNNFSILLKSKLFGLHNVYNILAGFSLGVVLGLESKKIKKAIEDFEGVEGRLERVNSYPLKVFIDYAHTPHSLKCVIKSLKNLIKGKLWVVFGCGGERDRAKRPRMGKIATSLADYVILTNDNPRGESPQSIVKDIKRGIRKKNYSVELDRKKAIRMAIFSADEKDTVLIAGKGHERRQVFKERSIPFSDKKIAEYFLKKRFG